MFTPALPTREAPGPGAAGYPVAGWGERRSAAASGAVRGLLEGPPSLAGLLGTAAGIVWLQVDDYVLALSGPNPMRPPNGVTVAGSDWAPRVTSGCIVGNGRIATTDLLVSVVRWWNPRPALGTVPSWTLDTRSKRASELIGEVSDPLAAAMAAGVDALSDLALSHLGRGPGLTPEGDDVVIGLLAGLRLLGESVGAPRALELVDALSPIVGAAPSHTAALSATLLGHAWHGEVPAPLGAFLQAMTGRGHLEDALVVLGGLGATSGMAMGRGALAAARHVVRESRHDR